MDELPPPPPRQKGKPRPRAAADPSDNPGTRVVLYLAKWGRQMYVGHLDTMRHVMRSFRRAGLDLSYTQGFNPKPRLVSCPPLPVGMASLRDPIEVRLIDPPDTGEILSRLATAVPDDLAFVDAEVVPEGGRSLSRRLQSAEYTAWVPVERDVAVAGARALLLRDTIAVARTRKGRTSTVDIRPYIIDASVPAGRKAPLPFTVPKGRVPLAFSLHLPGSGGAKPLEVVRAVFGEMADDAWVIRTLVRLEEHDRLPG